MRDPAGCWCRIGVRVPGGAGRLRSCPTLLLRLHEIEQATIDTLFAEMRAEAEAWCGWACRPATW